MLQSMIKQLLVLVTAFSFITLAGCESSSSGSEPESLKATEKSGSQLRAAPLFTGVDGARGGALGSDVFLGMDDVQPFYAEGPYAGTLKRCALIEDEMDSCSLSTLPFLGMDYSVPSVDQIMSRVLVSHQWMGKNFKQALELLPSDALLLFKSATAVVIATDIRPSYFWAATGAVYIDPDLLWLSAEEKKTISNFFVPDYHHTEHEIPGFRSWWRYVKDGELAFIEHSLFDEKTRTMSEAILPLASLLFHELAHANDFFSQEYFLQFDGSTKVAHAAMEQVGYRPSDELYERSPLRSGLMFDLAEVMYGDASASQLPSTDALEVALAFDADLANDDYAFLSQHEDFAMLVEETFMKYYFDVDREVAYLNAPINSAMAGCDEFKIAWGMRSRISLRQIASRAEFVVRKILPHKNWTTFFNGLPAAQLLSPGHGWCSSIASSFENSQLPDTHAGKVQRGYMYTP